MLHANLGKALYAPATRTLDQAARAAHEIAAAENLPIASNTDPEKWHRETILKMVPVYGVRNRRKEALPADAHLEGDRALAPSGEWTDLQVKRADFHRYLDWLHTFW